MRAGLAAAALVAAVAPAQIAVPEVANDRGPRLVVVAPPVDGDDLDCARATQHGLVPTRDGSLFVLVSRFGLRHSLELWRSLDGGLTWRWETRVPTPDAHDGALAPDGDRLAVAWTAENGEAAKSVFWECWSIAEQRWLGDSRRLANASKYVDQYHCSDLVRTAGGAFVVVIGCDKHPPNPPWTCSWSTGLRWLRPGDAEWQPLRQVNVADYGVGANLWARGETVDVTYRTSPGPAIHGLRSFDAANGAFVQADDERAMVEPTVGAEIVNTGVLCGDEVGGRTLLHVLAGSEPGRGRLAVSFCGAGETRWRTVDLAADEPLQAGNENPQHFTLARGPGNQVFAYFAKASEQFAHLWQCVLEDGVAAVPPQRVVAGEPGDFRRVSGMRCADCFSTAHVVVSGRADEFRGGRVAVFGRFPARTVWREPR